MKKKDLNEMSNEELWQLFPIILSPHNPEWPGRYKTEKELLIKTIGAENIVRINHIGSTAVPGLTAKPTIDILLEIQQKTRPPHPDYRVSRLHLLPQTRQPASPHDVYERIYARRI